MFKFIHLANWQEFAKIAVFANMAGWPPCMELIYIHLAIWQEFAKLGIFAEIAVFANMAGHHVWNWFTYIWRFDKNSPKSAYSPKSLYSPTWLATMYGTDLHTFGDYRIGWIDEKFLYKKTFSSIATKFQTGVIFIWSVFCIISFHYRLSHLLECAFCEI